MHWLSDRDSDPKEEVVTPALPQIMPALPTIEGTDIEGDLEDDKNNNKIVLRREG